MVAAEDEFCWRIVLILIWLVRRGKFNVVIFFFVIGGGEFVVSTTFTAPERFQVEAAIEVFPQATAISAILGPTGATVT